MVGRIHNFSTEFELALLVFIDTALSISWSQENPSHTYKFKELIAEMVGLV